MSPSPVTSCCRALLKNFPVETTTDHEVSEFWPDRSDEGRPNGTDGDAPTACVTLPIAPHHRFPIRTAAMARLSNDQAYPGCIALATSTVRRPNSAPSFEARNHQLHTFDHVLLRRVHDELKGGEA
jgi:hypothetical protein